MKPGLLFQIHFWVTVSLWDATTQAVGLNAQKSALYKIFYAVSSSSICRTASTAHYFLPGWMKCLLDLLLNPVRFSLRRQDQQQLHLCSSVMHLPSDHQSSPLLPEMGFQCMLSPTSTALPVPTHDCCASQVCSTLPSSPSLLKEHASIAPTLPMTSRRCDPANFLFPG